MWRQSAFSELWWINVFILRNILPTTCFSSISSCSNSYNYFYVIVVIVLLQVHRRQNREDCLIDVQTERFCATCRLMKCLMVEMRLDNTISEDIIRGKQSAAVVKEGNMVVGIKFHTKPLTYHFLCCSTLLMLHLPRNDRLSRTSFDWNILSNVTHAFDKFSPASLLRHCANLDSLHWVLHIHRIIYFLISRFSNTDPSRKAFSVPSKSARCSEPVCDIHLVDLWNVWHKKQW